MMALNPATAADLIDLLKAAKKSPLPKRAYTCLLVQVLVSRSWMMRSSNGDALALGGLFEVDGAPAQAWFIVRPDIGGSRLAGLVMAGRRHLDEVAPTCASGIEVQVRRDNRAGVRLARSLGFRETGRVGLGPWGDEIGSVQVWERHDGRDGYDADGQKVCCAKKGCGTTGWGQVAARGGIGAARPD